MVVAMQSQRLYRGVQVKAYHGAETTRSVKTLGGLKLWHERRIEAGTHNSMKLYQFSLESGDLHAVLQTVIIRFSGIVHPSQRKIQEHTFLAVLCKKDCYGVEIDVETKFEATGLYHLNVEGLRTRVV